MLNLFVSDVHLNARRPEIVAAFLGFLGGGARHAEALYILGDLFDQWLGDDDDRSPHAEVTRALRALRDHGTRVRLLHGNHDFLLGDSFMAGCRCELLPDPSVVDVGGTPVLISHGDMLCTDDTDYQAFRTYSRNPDTQRWFLGLPLEARYAKAAELRNASDAHTALTPDDIMDVNALAVEALMDQHCARHLVHGHTHRPGIHSLRVGGRESQRIVLGDWYAQDSVLIWDHDGYRLGRVTDLDGAL